MPSTLQDSQPRERSRSLHFGESQTLAAQTQSSPQPRDYCIEVADSGSLAEESDVPETQPDEDPQSLGSGPSSGSSSPKLRLRREYCAGLEGTVEWSVEGLKQFDGVLARDQLLSMVAHPCQEGLAPVCTYCAQVLLRNPLAKYLSPGNVNASRRLRNSFMLSREYYIALRATFMEILMDKPDREFGESLIGQFCD